MPWFAQARDAADGRLSLKDGALHLDWDIEKSAKAIEAVVRTHEKLARATGGMPLVPLTWTLGKDLITPHPLGGANMGTTPHERRCRPQGRGVRLPQSLRRRRRHRARRRLASTRRRRSARSPNESPRSLPPKGGSRGTLMPQSPRNAIVTYRSFGGAFDKPGAGPHTGAIAVRVGDRSQRRVGAPRATQRGALASSNRRACAKARA